MPFKAHLIPARFIKLGVIAAVSFFGSLCLTFILTEWFGISPRLSFALVLVVVFTCNFMAARHWAFRERLIGSDPRRQLVYCALVSLGFRCLEWIGFAILSKVLVWHYMVSLTIVLVVSFTIKSIIFDRYVFR